MSPARSNPRNRRGFTLIELIVVVIIIAVLAAIGAVAYNQYAAKARSNAVLGSAASLRTAVMAAAARDDQSPATEVDALWTAAGGDSSAFLTALSASYTGPLTYTPAGDTSPATLQVGSANGGTHAACLTLPDSASAPVTLTAGPCDAGAPAAPGGSSSTPPPPLAGTITALATTATVSPYALAVNAVGTRVAAVNNAGSGVLAVYNLDPATGNLTGAGSVAAGSGPNNVAFSPDGTLLAVDDYTGGVLRTFSLSGSGAPVAAGTATFGGSGSGVAFSPDGTLIAAARGDGYVVMYTVTSAGALTAVPSGSYPAGTDPVGAYFSPDGHLLVTTNYSGNAVTLFVVNSGGTLTPAGTYPAGTSPWSAAFSPDSRLLAVGDDGDGKVSMFTVSGDTLVPAGTTTIGGAVDGVAFSPDGRALLASDYNGAKVTLLNVDQVTGSLSAAGTASTGSGPRKVAFVPGTSLFIVGNNASSTVSVYQYE